MTEKNNLLFVQFIHPGRECNPQKKQKNFEWNNKKHGRKFIKNYGHYWENGEIKKDDLVFWCEWEPQANIIKSFNKDNDNKLPKHLCEPFYSLPKNENNLLNTDPFVFGKQFHYVCCQQFKKGNGKPSATKLRNLDEASVILFGSCLGENFIIDTVFVVDYWYDITSIKDAEKYVSSCYKDVSLVPLFGADNICNKTFNNNCIKSDNLSYRLYFGATPDNPKHGMFSFFPCLPYENEHSFFSRPIISMRDFINNKKTQGVKYSRIINVGKNRELWYQLKKQVEEQNLKLGVYSDLPKQIE